MIASQLPIAAGYDKALLELTKVQRRLLPRRAGFDCPTRSQTWREPGPARCDCADLSRRLWAPVPSVEWLCFPKDAPPVDVTGSRSASTS